MAAGTPRVVVIGSGLAGYGILRELRRLSPDACLTLVTADDGHFYSKPALSTALAKGKTADTLVTTTAERMAGQLKLDLRTQARVEVIDRKNSALVLASERIGYDRLILALGAVPIRPALAGNAAGEVMAVNTLDEYRTFSRRLRPGARVLILGSGLVGTEFANDLAGSGHDVVVVDPLGHPLAQLVPPQVGMAIRTALAERGVTWRLGHRVVAVERAGEAYRGLLDDGGMIDADAVLSAIGLRAHVALAEAAGLKIDRGILVDATGRTSDPNIFAIGDCAHYPQGPAAYVTPIMAAARAIAPSVLGAPTAIRFPPLSVQVKTSAYPLVLLSPPPDTPGMWIEEERSTDGLVFTFRAADGRMLGYILGGDRCQRRIEMDRTVATAEPTYEGETR